jgi:hypothetical protein
MVMNMMYSERSFFVLDSSKAAARLTLNGLNG